MGKADEMIVSMAALNDQIRQLNKKTGRNFKLWMFDIVLTAALFVVGIYSFAGYDTAHQNRQSLKSSCQTTNTARADNRDFWENQKDGILFLIIPRPGAEQTPEQKKNLDNFIAAATAKINRNFAPLDCQAVVKGKTNPTVPLPPVTTTP
jgi:hypothetical protein